jgi:hypothetical protein
LRVSRLPFLALLILAIFVSFGGTNLGGQTAAPAGVLDGPSLNHPDPVTVQPSTSTQPSIPPENLPENPRPHRVIDKKFIAVMGTLGAVESMRFVTRQLVLENEMTAGAPWVTSVPSHTHLVLKYAPIFAAELVVAYEIKKPHDWLPGDRVIRKLWWLYPAAMAAIHLHNAIGNINTQAPAACPVAECQQP